MGKDPGDDFREGKVTLPVILAYATGNAAECAVLEGCFAPGGERNDAALAEVQRVLASTGGIQESMAEARRYADSAAGALQSAFSPSPLREALLEALAFSIQRAF
jgi:octaprenyl-diphosphate synthase